MASSSSDRIDRDLVAEAVGLHRSIFRTLQANAGEEWSHLPLTMAQVKTLFAVGNLGPVSIGEVARAVGVALPTASVGVDGLVSHGLVVRSEDHEDRRRTLAQLTTSGESLVNRLRQGSLQLMTIALRRLDKVQLEDLVTGLTALSAALNAELENSPVLSGTTLSSEEG
jgi:DNA-binding MarR family transcriptional regulator